jgi:hypothetical protein
VRTSALIAALLLTAWSVQVAADERAVVLVVSAQSPITQLDSLEVRKLFLGLPVAVQGRLLRPVDNFSDAQLRDVFLQHVVAMSQSAYDRRILSQVIREGRPRPLELNSLSPLLRALEDDPQAVSFAWLKDVSGNVRLKILRVLWQD